MKNFINKVFKKVEVEQTLYQVIGEENGVYELVKVFYEIMESDPKAKDCLNVHELIDGKIPDEVKKKLFMFVCGWFGGPNLFVEAYGHPRMRKRHLHVKIGLDEANQWLYCMEKSLKQHSRKIKGNNYDRMYSSFKALAIRVINQEQ